MFAVPDESTVEIVSSQQIGTCPPMPEAAFQGCNAKYDLVVTYEADFYLCSDEQAEATADGCPKAAWQFLQRATLKKIKIDGWTHHFSGKDIVRAGWQDLFGDVAGSILFSFFAEDLMDCWHGDKTACAWSLATYVPVEGLLAPISRAVMALDAAARTGIEFEDAFKALRALDGLSEAAKTGIGLKALDKFVKTCTRVAGAPLSVASSASGTACPLRLIAYNSDEMSHLAYKYRVENGYFGGDHNVAVARVPGWNDPKTGDYVIANSKFSGHSETEILDQLKEKGVDPKKITALYTERQPCPNCDGALNKALKEGTVIYYSVPYEPEFASYSKALLASYVERSNGGRLTRSPVNRHDAGGRLDPVIPENQQPGSFRSERPVQENP